MSFSENMKKAYSKVKTGIQYTSTLVLNRAANGAAGVRELVSYAGPFAIVAGALWKSVGLFKAREKQWTVSKIQTSLYEQPWSGILKGNYSAEAKATAQVCYNEAPQRAAAVFGQISLPTQESMLSSIVNNDWINPAVKLGWWLSTFATVFQAAHLAERVISEYMLQKRKDKSQLKAAGYAALALFINPRTRKFDLFAHLPYSAAAFYLFNWVLQPGINHVFNSFDTDKFTDAVNSGAVYIANGNPFNNELFMLCDINVVFGNAWLKAIIDSVSNPAILTPLILISATVGANYLGDLITSYYNLRHPAMIDADGKTFFPLTSEGQIDITHMKRSGEAQPLLSGSTTATYDGAAISRNDQDLEAQNSSSQAALLAVAKAYNYKRAALSGGTLPMETGSTNIDGVAGGEPESSSATVPGAGFVR